MVPYIYILSNPLLNDDFLGVLNMNGEWDVWKSDLAYRIIIIEVVSSLGATSSLNCPLLGWGHP